MIQCLFQGYIVVLGQGLSGAPFSQNMWHFQYKKVKKKYFLKYRVIDFEINRSPIGVFQHLTE